MICITSMALLLLILLYLFASPSAAEPLWYICGSGNFTRNSTYSSNLNQLIFTLSSNALAGALATGFATATIGIVPDRVYGLTLCRGDTDIANCRSCISTAISDTNQLCSNKKEATIWYDLCQLSYSNQEIQYGPDVNTSVQCLLANTQKVSADRLQRFEILNTELMGNLSELAVTDTSRLFATGEAALTAGDNIYGLVQCTLDLSVGDCRTCLQQTVDFSKFYLQGAGKGGRALGILCNIRYELYKFYNGTPMLQLSSDQSPSLPLPTNASMPNVTHQQPSSPLPRNASMPNVTHQQADLSHGGRKIVIRRVAIFLPVGILLLICTIIYLIWMRKRRKKGTNRLQNDQMSLNQGTNLASKLEIKENGMEFSLIKFSSIMEATYNFSSTNKLGQGGFGSVYKGYLPSGECMAVKRLDEFSGQGLEEFMNEIKLIAKLQHQNLVKLLGCCIEGNEKLLVYEYMPNKSLDYHLFDQTRKEQLDWSKRFAIIDGIAQGLLYLHKYSRVRIIHRDLKASNILLDLQMNPKISDFGLARIYASTTPTNTNRIVGTYGYMSPEYAMEGFFSVKSDVFSFGVLMLEIISGKRNTSFHKSGKALNLLVYAWELWKNEKWLDFVDPSLGEKILSNEVSKCIIVALMCVQEKAEDRPIMSEIITMLGSENIILQDPKKPAFFTGGNEGPSEFSIYASKNEITLTILEGR
ncbi:cysteine-rich receptor-like protein kinase 19 [Dendrobium catenatum]|uniref:cysteine-rich receptor-like protein kinase 19 n=1 Tax=Dendrobium catenatum TaxID=906689 RepID=UPI0009F5317C|nr:cysteine-rich receptor-like protein kinase 19 [Dendrobium catenatum]